MKIAKERNSSLQNKLPLPKSKKPLRDLQRSFFVSFLITHYALPLEEPTDAAEEHFSGLVGDEVFAVEVFQINSRVVERNVPYGELDTF